MFRPASRVLLRAPATARGPASRRLISTAPAEASKSRSWKNTAVRLGLAAGAVYYYNTASVFAEPPSFSLREQITTSEPATSLTLDSVKPKIRAQKESESQSKPAPSPSADAPQQQQPSGSDAAVNPQELEEEASQEAAFNPETGEINWDCPCLGGMAHGPCGEDFKAAFSCFVFSTEEPKGIDCIEKFKAMQDCFRQHPDVYGAEIDDDEEAPAAPPVSAEDAPAAVAPQSTASAAEIEASSHPDEKRARAKETVAETKTVAAGQPELAESDELLPKAWHDTEAKNEQSEK
ncbi:hypothetical protein P170DRAFT_478973 [Aspergillus steynii IBT 23096]|uniref:Mitochondrial intermembrane space import and assembly protein 40 n=1 Tax=Aspergillus steynii IBT 23096 TaxID=1392250 RepID=A0A2I2FZJ3_9EURO|nr:uncharacterized protein P170DRAFT_478973 [Aspergillus steynii IBT 23096]PLB46049.1 hypothetical protein P170DRAFT_478973 [Aspergillus steynii IBT 23096]